MNNEKPRLDDDEIVDIIIEAMDNINDYDVRFEHFAQAILEKLKEHNVLAVYEWKTIDSAPLGKELLLYCPDRGVTNPERIELGTAGNGRGSYHAWATHWMPVPSKPKAPQPAAGE